MAYVTSEQIETRLGSVPFVQLTDDAGSGSPDLAVVDAARQAAEGEADSYLARRYAVPIDVNAHGELSALLTGVVLDLVEYRLHARRPADSARRGHPADDRRPVAGAGCGRRGGLAVGRRPEPQPGARHRRGRARRYARALA